MAEYADFVSENLDKADMASTIRQKRIEKQITARFSMSPTEQKK
jgi:hypothetical protein